MKKDQLCSTHMFLLVSDEQKKTQAQGNLDILSSQLNFHQSDVSRTISGVGGKVSNEQ